MEKLITFKYNTLKLEKKCRFFYEKIVFLPLFFAELSNFINFIKNYKKNNTNCTRKKDNFYVL